MVSFGEMPSGSIVLIVALAAVWGAIGTYHAVNIIKKKKFSDKS
jgi:hypothetical protein